MSGRSTIEKPVAASANLKIRMLGPPSVTWEGRRLTLARRQARALLYRLAVYLQPVPREQLCFLFWPDTLESGARRSLSRLLTHLRRALPEPKLLVTVGDQVGLDPEQVWSDTAAFARIHGGSGGQLGVEALRQAVDLYHGPFLAGFSLPSSPEFDEWASSESRSFEHQYLEALSTLVGENAARGAHSDAISCAQRYLETDELNEEIHRQLIQLYAATDDRSAALRQFERCTTVLEQELGVGPLPETRAAYQAVLENRLPVDPPPVFEPEWTTLPSLDAPLVGREEAQRFLEQAYTRVESGDGSVVLIDGEPGIGKSRLVQEFATRRSGQAWVLVGAGQPGSQTLPYQPVVQAMRSLSLSQVFVSPVWLAEASRLIPELRSLHPNLPEPMPGAADETRTRLFEALCQILIGLTDGSHPLILCLDDLHWADDATLDWLAYLASKLRGRRLLVIGTYRGEEREAVNSLRRSLTRLGVLSELRLEGMDVEEVRQLLRHLVGPDAESEPLAGRLWQATAGNPFFLLETLRALIERGQLIGNPAGLADLPLPSTVREAVLARLMRLGPVSHQVLEAGSVVHTTFDFELVHRTAGRGEMETMDGLDELVTHQLLVERAGVYQFQHEIIRAVVYRGLSLWRRRLLHRRAGVALQTLQSNDHAVLAFHFEQAGEPGLAAGYALQAGQTAQAVFAYVEARAFFNRALVLLKQELSHLQDSEAIAAIQRLRIRALRGRGWAFRLLGDMEAFERDTRDVSRLAELLGDQRTLAHLRWREAYAHRWFCRYTEALEAAREGVRLAQAAGASLLEAMCHREVGVAARETGAYEQAQTALESALDLFTDQGDVLYQIHTLGNLSTLHVYTLDYAKAMDRAQQALTRCEVAQLTLERRLPLGDMGAAEAGLGDPYLAQAHLQESLAIARQIADRTQEIFCLGHLGWLYIRLNRPAQALEHLQTALDLAERIDSCAEQSWLHSGLAEAYCLTDRPDSFQQAVAHAERASELAQATEKAHDVELARQVLSRLNDSNL